MSISRKQIAFDLNQKSLKRLYPRGGSQSEYFYKRAYSDIQNFMLKNGFSHRQYSVYESEKPFSKDDIGVLCEKLVMEFPWISNCINEIDVTYIGEKHSIKDTILDFYNNIQKEGLAMDEEEFKDIENSSDLEEEDWDDEIEP